jgi:hypothetical protein
MKIGLSSAMLLRRFLPVFVLLAFSGILSACGDHSVDDHSVVDSVIPSHVASLASESGAQAAVLGNALEPYRVAASSKGLPTPFFDQLISANAWIDVKKTSGGPSYKPGFFTGGTIYHPAVGTPLSVWTASDWSNFYNELFHAWWGNIFMKEARFGAMRDRFPSNPDLLNKYRAANPRDPKLAMEEAWSETVASVLIIWYPRPYFDSDGRLLGYRSPDLVKMAYKVGHTVAPVSHSDRPGYTPAAENTYPDEYEYGALFQMMFGKKLP